MCRRRASAEQRPAQVFIKGHIIGFSCQSVRESVVAELPKTSKARSDSFGPSDLLVGTLQLPVLVMRIVHVVCSERGRLPKLGQSQEMALIH